MKNLYIVFLFLISHSVKGQPENNPTNGFLVKVIESSKLYENRKYFFIPDTSFSNTLFTNELVYKPQYYIGESIWLANWNNILADNLNQVDSVFNLNSYLINKNGGGGHDKTVLFIIHCNMKAKLIHKQIKEYNSEFISISTGGVDPQIGSTYLYTDVFDISFIDNLRNLSSKEINMLNLSITEK